jgi:hypothetical protein
VAITIANSSPTTLMISTVAITGSALLDYSVAGTCAGKTLVPGARCVITVRFRPSTVGVRHARVLVTENAPSSPQSIELVGGGCR